MVDLFQFLMDSAWVLLCFLERLPIAIIPYQLQLIKWKDSGTL